MPYTKKLGKVGSQRQRGKLLAVLKDIHPTHNSRLWFVGFLRYVGYTKEEVQGIIFDLNEWDDYNEEETWKQICSVYGEIGPIPYISPNSRDSENHGAKRRAKQHPRRRPSSLSRLKQARLDSIKLLPGGIDKDAHEYLNGWLKDKGLPVYETELSSGSEKEGDNEE